MTGPRGSAGQDLAAPSSGTHIMPHIVQHCQHRHITYIIYTVYTDDFVPLMLVIALAVVMLVIALIALPVLGIAFPVSMALTALVMTPLMVLATFMPNRGAFSRRSGLGDFAPRLPLVAEGRDSQPSPLLLAAAWPHP